MSFITDFDAIVDYPGLSPAELGFLMYFFRNQGESFIFYARNIKKKFGIKDTAYSNVIHSLQDKDLISYTQMNEGQFGGIQIKINISRIRSGEQVTKTGKPVHGKPVHGKSVHGKSVHGKSVHGESETGISVHGKSVHGESETGISVHGKSGHINEVNIEGSKSSKGVNGVREGDSVPAAHCDTIPAPEIPAGTQTELFPEPIPADIPPASIPEPKKASTKFIPPTKAEVRAKLEAVLTEKGTIQRWTDSDLQSFTDRFFDWYDSAHWLKNDGRKMKDWQRALSNTWLAKREYLPEKASVPAFPGAPVNQQAPKSFREQDRDYANRHLRDPFGTAISDCVDAAIIMGGDPCDYGLAPQFHEEAMKLMQQRKEQAAKGHNINPDEVLTPGNQR